MIDQAAIALQYTVWCGAKVVMLMMMMMISEIICLPIRLFLFSLNTNSQLSSTRAACSLAHCHGLVLIAHNTVLMNVADDESSISVEMRETIF